MQITITDDATLRLLTSAIPPLLAVFLAGFLGNRLSARWSLWQKRREASLQVVAEFTRLYGEFFSLWKLWNFQKDNAAINRTAVLPDMQWQLLQRAAAAEAQIEALFVRLASLSELSEQDIEVAGKFRQTYQQLRQCIKKDKKLDWGFDSHPQYLAFKRLAAAFALILGSADRKASPSAANAAAALLAITSNEREEDWMMPVGADP